MMSTEQICTTLERLPEVLDVLLGSVEDAVLRERPEPGEWCPLEVIGHLIACDHGAFRDRIDAIVTGDRPIPGFRPWDAINARDFAAEPLSDLLAELQAERATSVGYLRTLNEEQLTRTGSLEGEERRFAAADFLHEWPFHDQDHLMQILSCLKLRYLPHMTETMRSALIS